LNRGLVSEGIQAMKAPAWPRGRASTSWRTSARAPGHVLLLGHFDTVWPVGRLAEAPFT